MKEYLLSLEASTEIGGWAVFEIYKEKNKKIIKLLGSILLNSRTTYSVRLMPDLDFLMKDIGININQINYIGLSTGPGSFTAVKIAVATVKTLALSLGMDSVYSTNTLMSICYNFINLNSFVLVMQDAKKKQAYSAFFEIRDNKIKTLIKPVCCYPEELIEKIDIKLNSNIILAGSGINLFPAVYKKLSKKYKIKIYNNNIYTPSPINTGLICFDKIKRNQKSNADKLTPLYLRLSDAQMLWKKKTQSI